MEKLFESIMINVNSIPDNSKHKIFIYLFIYVPIKTALDIFDQM